MSHEATYTLKYLFSEKKIVKTDFGAIRAGKSVFGDFLKKHFRVYVAS